MFLKLAKASWPALPQRGHTRAPANYYARGRETCTLYNAASKEKEEEEREKKTHVKRKLKNEASASPTLAARQLLYTTATLDLIYRRLHTRESAPAPFEHTHTYKTVPPSQIIDLII